MAETTLEIKVFDDIKVDDSLERVIEVIVEEFKKWAVSDDDRPFTLSVKKQVSRGPPNLNINVHDTIKTKAVFGTH